MKNCFFLFILVASFHLPEAGAQLLPSLQPEQDACSALPVCGGKFTTPYSYQGAGRKIEQSLFTGAACFDESNSVWLKLTVAKAGTIAFTITPFSVQNDYDFSVYEITGSNCNDINGVTRIRCNGSDITSCTDGITGINPGWRGFESGPGPGSDFIASINAVAGNVYLILIDNFIYGARVSGFSIDFSPSTATFLQPPPPKLSYATQAAEITLVNVFLNGKVKCSSIAQDGSDFRLSAVGTELAPANVSFAIGRNCTADGYTSEISLAFSSPLPAGKYVLYAKAGSDENTMLDFCNSALATPDSVAFEMKYPDTTSTIETGVSPMVQKPIPVIKDTVVKIADRVPALPAADSTVEVFIPETFTPNGDGRNDIFKPDDIKFLKMIEFRVMNNKGEELFSTTNKNGGWDGNYLGKKQETDTYRYIIRLAWPDGRIQTHRGNVELLR